MGNNHLHYMEQGDKGNTKNKIINKVFLIITIVLLSASVVIQFIDINKNSRIGIGLAISVLVVVHSLIYEKVNRKIASLEFALGIGIFCGSVYMLIFNMLSGFSTLFEIILNLIS